MPSVAVSSKNKGKVPNRERRSRSRQGTPVSASTTAHLESSPVGNGYFQTSLSGSGLAFTRSLLEVIGEKSVLPSPSLIGAALEHTKGFNATSGRRGDRYESLLREASTKLKELEQEERETERVEKELQAQEAEEQRKLKLKKATPKKRDREEDRPPAVGEHKVARQDGGNDDDSSGISSPPSPNAPSLMGDQAGDRASKSRSSSAEPRQPPPAPAIPSFQLFGADPNTFPDPIVYDIREVTPGTSEAEKLEIYQVASYPHDDLRTLIAGPLPDKDFSTAKDTVKQSATAVQFASYVEPFIRPLNDEDTAFLRERGDRTHIFEATPRGPRSFRDLWTEEDGGMVLDIELGQPPNEARGTIEDINDVTAESEDVSAGPLQERLSQLLRPQGGNGAGHAETNGDTTMLNGVNGDADGEGDAATVNGDTNHVAQQPATFLPESTSSTWKATAAMTPELITDPNKRILVELKNLGYIPEDSEYPNYDAAQDNEVAERLRILQEQLKKQSIINGARKARVLELTEERMAVQEYMNIADDLDNQLNQAYLKRNRNMGKSKKNPAKKAQAPGAAEGIGRPAMGEGIRSLMERKFKWNDWIGKVVNYGHAPIPTETVFPKQLMDEYERKEEALWETETNEAAWQSTDRGAYKATEAVKLRRSRRLGGSVVTTYSI